MTDSCKFEKLIIIYHSNLKALKHINSLTRITSCFLKPDWHGGSFMINYSLPIAVVESIFLGT